jgi:hypothetical protein
MTVQGSNHLFDRIDIDRQVPGITASENRVQQPKPLSVNLFRLIIRIDEESREKTSTTGPHAVEVDLGFGDPPRPIQRLGVRVGAADLTRHRFDLGGEHRIREN